MRIDMKLWSRSSVDWMKRTWRDQWAVWVASNENAGIDGATYGLLAAHWNKSRKLSRQPSHPNWIDRLIYAPLAYRDTNLSSNLPAHLRTVYHLNTAINQLTISKIISTPTATPTKSINPLARITNRIIIIQQQQAKIIASFAIITCLIILPRRGQTL